jgi:hypothetical protein
VTAALVVVHRLDCPLQLREVQAGLLVGGPANQDGQLSEFLFVLDSFSGSVSGAGEYSRQGVHDDFVFVDVDVTSDGFHESSGFVFVVTGEGDDDVAPVF